MSALVSARRPPPLLCRRPGTIVRGHACTIKANCGWTTSKPAVPARRRDQSDSSRGPEETAWPTGRGPDSYARAREINQLLDAETALLDQNFPFAPPILADETPPPVIQTGRDTVRQHHDAQLQFADAVDVIVRPAQLAVAPPDWRTDSTWRLAPAPPDETLLPDRAKAAEVAYWERSVEDGWTRGGQQADRPLPWN